MQFTQGKKRNLLLVLMCVLFISVFCCVHGVTVSAVHFEEGEGTAEEPYAIHSLSDLLRFSEEVEGGRTFAGEYVALYGDFSMKRFGASFPVIRGFAGTFDGNGHTLSRYDGEVLFADLTGTVCNLALSTGEYRALASGGTGRIVNCTAEVIAENFDGEILSAYATETVAVGGTGVIAYSTAPRIAEDFAGEITDCTPFYATAFNQGELDALLSDNRRLTCWHDTVSPDELCSWSRGKLAEKGYAFAGRGTPADPYLVESKEDLYYLSAYVNAGRSFAGETFLQTADLSLAGETLLPIGKTGGGNYFFGTYDGGGHTLSAFVIDETYGSVDNALFGTLGGTVLNLGLENGVIGGANCASFAAGGASGTALVFNCYSTVTLRGLGRNGGIVDNYNGSVVNCWYGGEFPLCSYTAGEIAGSYAAAQLVTDNFTGELTNSEILPWGSTVRNALNYGAVFYQMSYDAGGTRIVGWKGVFSPALSVQQRAFAGAGTQRDPYQIASPLDLALLSGTVNGGRDYEGVYFRQTVDLDLAEIPNFVPIGTFDGGSYFCGTYDGDGHTISNLTITGAVRDNVNNNALFGTLGGTVINLGIVSGSIAGSCVASFAVSGLPEARIVNCHSSVNLYGVTRSGGIVDNFAGKVALCYYTGGAPLCSYTATAVNYCYASTVVTADYSGTQTGNGDLSDLTTKLNDNLLRACMRTAFSAEGLRFWSDGRCVGDTYALAGDGSSGRPYEIGSVSDLLYFNASVNSGTTYENKMVLQTVDLDLQGEDFIPIGLAGSPYRFYGTYNGGGHTVSNLYIQSTELSTVNGFFGSLFGKVINLGLESGRITGEYVGGIASEGHYWKTLLYNCYSRVPVSGVRAGGLVDNFGGDVINCWYDNADTSIPLCSYRANTVYRCYASGLIGGPGSTVDETTECSERLDFAQKSVSEKFYDFFNRGILISSVEYGFVRSEMVLWEIGADGRLTFADERFTLNLETIRTYFDLLVEVYFWNIVAIAAVIAAVVAIVLAFVLERKK